MMLMKRDVPLKLLDTLAVSVHPVTLKGGTKWAQFSGGSPTYARTV